MEFDAVSLTLDEMIQMDPLALHHLAKKSTGTLTRYRALLGRLLLAIHRTDACLEHGCSSGAHYAVLQLGLSHKEARELIRVARELEALPKQRHPPRKNPGHCLLVGYLVRSARPRNRPLHPHPRLPQPATAPPESMCVS